MAEEEKEMTPAPDVGTDAEAAEDTPPAAEGGGTASKPKRKPLKHKKAWITVGVIVAVIVVAGVGFMVWHEQPSFCNAICHSPMDYYVETYSSDDESMGVVVHAEEGVNCLDCHNPQLTEQITEVMCWLSDDYLMDADGLMLADGLELASEEFCTKGGCHDMDQVTADTWGFEDNEEQYNPHSSHQDYALECNDCHKSHSTSVLMCNECHTLNMPEGWEAPSDSDE